MEVKANHWLKQNKPLVMGILNVTPDSFSDGGQFDNVSAALERVAAMIEEGADIIDIGGESTRPGAPEVALAEELARTIPVIKAIKQQFDIPVSIDTSKAEVMAQAVAAGADMINDVCALSLPGSLAMAAKLKVPVCLMHMQGQPRTMQNSPCYTDVVEEVLSFFEERIEACVAAGIERELVILDPGFGFGKNLNHNYQLLANVDKIKTLKLPILIGLSRKSMFGDWLNRSVEQRLAASLAGVMISAQQGAQIFRVHDVQETADVLKVINKTEEFKYD